MQNQFEVQGTISLLCPVKSGVGKTSGKEWQSQDIVIEYNDPYKTFPRHITLRIFGSERLTELQPKLGELVRVQFTVDSSEYNGRWYNNLDVVGMMRINAQQPQQPAAPQYGGQQPTPPAGGYNAPF